MKEEVFIESSVPRQSPVFFGRLSWGAILGGVFIALVTALVLSVLGVAIGAGTVDPLKEQHPLKGLGIGTTFWLLVTGLTSSFFGAWVAGRFSGSRSGSDGAIHGLVTWGATTICMGLLVSTAIGNLLTGTANLFGKAVSATGQAGAAVATQGAQAGVNWDSIKQEIQEKFPQAGRALAPTGRTNAQESTGTNSSTEARQSPQALAVLTKMFSKGGAAAAPAEREQAINIIASEQNVTREEATSMVDDWDRKYQQAKAQTEQKVREAGDATARGVSRGAFGSFVLLILCGIAAFIGGRVGAFSALRPLARHVATT
jgi:hypothetical protein